MKTAEILYQREKIEIPVRTLALTAVCGLGLQALLARSGGLIRAYNDIPALFGYGAAVLLAFRYGVHVLKPVFLWLDGISFEWYLVHVDAIMWTYYFAKMFTDSEWLRALCATGFSIAAAWLFSQLVRTVMKLIPE